MSGEIIFSYEGERMFFLLYIVIIVIMYVVTFKENFTEEKIQKVTPVLSIIGIVTGLLAILSAII